MIWFNKDGRVDEIGRDLAIAEALESLDPASQDPNYWFRFHNRVMAGASSELARRRMMKDLSVVDVMAAWSKTVVPTALLAAAVAALILVRSGSMSVQPQVMLTEGLDDPIPFAAESATPVAFASFAPEIF